MLFQDDDPESAKAQRKTPVEQAEMSEEARRKSATRITVSGLPVHSLRTVLRDLATLTCNEVTQPNHPFPITAQPTPQQDEAVQRPSVEPGKMIPVQQHP